MNSKSSIILISIILTTILIFAGCLVSLSYPTFLGTNNEYTLEIQTNIPLHNATFYLPLPVKNDTPTVGNRLLYPSDFKKEGYSVTFARFLPEIKLNATQTREYWVPGNDPCFVRIHADLWPNGSYYVDIVNGTNNLISPALFANTLYPVGNESIFLPKLDFSPAQPVKKSKLNPFSDWVEYTNQTTRQATWIYADYSTDSQTSVTIYTRIRGSNYWLDDYDTSIGNHYQDSFYEGLTGENRGVYFMTGDFTAGNMLYPDLSSPKWQRFIEQGAGQK